MRFALLALALGVACLSGCHPEPGTPDASGPKPTVHEVVPHRATVEQDLAVTGTLRAPVNAQATVRSAVTGIIDAVPVTVGESVKVGDTLVHLSERPVEGQIQQAEATQAQTRVQVQQAEVNAVQQHAQSQATVLQARSAVAAARANLLAAQATLSADRSAERTARAASQRLHALYPQGLVARKDLEASDLALRTAQVQVLTQQQMVDAQRDAVASQEQALRAAQAGALQDVVKQQDVQIARQQVGNARGAVLTAEGQRSFYTLRSPVRGQVTAVNASLGETVDPSTALVTVADLSHLQLQMAVPVAQAAAVHPGQEVHVMGLTTTVAVVGAQVDPASDTVTVRATVTNPGDRIPDGTFAPASIVLDRHADVLVVPRTAMVAWHDGHGTVMVLDDHDVVHATPVRVGLDDGRQVEIASGLPEHAHVVSEGGYGLPDGTAVQVVSP